MLDSNDEWTLHFPNSYIEQYGSVGGILFLLENRDKLINTDRLESPIIYAFKQATKYSLKGDYLNLYDELLGITKDFTDDMTVLNLIEYIDKNGLNYLREKINNLDKLQLKFDEKYLH